MSTLETDIRSRIKSRVLNPPGSSIRNRPFAAIVFAELCFTLFEIVSRRIPNHDTFQYFHLQYYFLNNALQHGEIPQWMPFMTHGTVANWWYVFQGGLFQNALLLMASITGFPKVDFITLFDLGMFADQLVLLIGTWLLAKRFYSSDWTCIFVCVTLVGGAIWMDQVSLNYHFYFGLPLILHFLYCFIEKGKWYHLFAALDLFALQTLGNPPYWIAFASLILFLFIILEVVLNYGTHIKLFETFKFCGAALAGLAAGAAAIGTAYLILRQGTQEIVMSGLHGRSVDGKVPFDAFCAYGSDISYEKWIELIQGIPSGLDNTLYFGFLGAPLLAVGLFRLRRERVHIHITVAIAILFGAGSWFVLVPAYYLWPFMKYYRHIGLTGSVSRLFLIFVAGFGFEAVFVSSLRDRKYLPWACAAMGVLACACIYCALSYPARKVLLDYNCPSYESPPAMFPSLVLMVFTAAAIFLSSFFLQVKPRYWLFAGLALVALEIYSYKGGAFLSRTFELSDPALIEFQPMPFARRRVTTFAKGNERSFRLSRDAALHGTTYWTMGSFAFVDEAGSSFRVDHWQAPLDDYFCTMWGDDLLSRQTIQKPHGFDLGFPTANDAAQKISGLTQDKIQFFSRASFVKDEVETAAMMKKPGFSGDVLLLLARPNDPLPSPSERVDLSANHRVDLKYAIDAFDSNNLSLTVTNTTSEPIWLMYSDVWNPNWSATVNGDATPVYKAELAYKAVRLAPGENKVRFRFRIPWVSTLYLFFCLNSVLWLGVTGCLLARIATTEPSPALGRGPT